jgi:hypothetical protein
MSSEKLKMIEISGLWADVMRMGVERHDQDDAEWWMARQNEIEFALRVLAGLGLANRRSPKNGTVEWSPSRSLKQLHRYSRRHHDYRHARDKHLKARVARRVLSLDNMISSKGNQNSAWRPPSK